MDANGLEDGMPIYLLFTVHNVGDSVVNTLVGAFTTEEDALDAITRVFTSVETEIGVVELGKTSWREGYITE